MSDAELLRGAATRNIAARDPAFIRAARALALDVLGPHPLGGYLTEQDTHRRDEVHESGHALVACVLGAPFAAVSVRPKALLSKVAYRDADARMTGDVAGAVAELRLLGAVVAEGCGKDLRHALRIAGGDIARVRAAVVRAGDILIRHRVALHLLVSELRDAGGLTMDEVRAIVGAHP